MKKFVLFIFIFFYFGVASGATVEFHYCMGKLVEWGMSDHAGESKSCSNCKMAESDSKNCCKKEQQQVKVSEAQKAQFSFQFKVVPSIIAAPFHFELISNTFQNEVRQTNYGHAPPIVANTPVFILLRTFRI